MSPVNEHDARRTTRTDFARAETAHVEAARVLPTATLHEAGGRIGALPGAIKPVHPSMSICGPALTIHSPPGDNLWLHRALAVARPGEVLVVHASGGFEYGYWGEIMSTMAHARQLGGLVIDACVRDGVLLGEIGFPVFARGLCIQGTGKDYGAIGWIGAAIPMGDVTVQPGDLIVGDGDGVVAIPRERAAEVIAAAQDRERKEAAILQRLRDGASTMEVYGFH